MPPTYVNKHMAFFRYTDLNSQIPADAFITFDPSLLLQVQFPQANGTLVDVTAGVQLPRNATVGPPLFNVVEASETVTNSDSKGRLPPIKGEPLDSTDFVVAMVDLDAPTPQVRLPLVKYTYSLS